METLSEEATNYLLQIFKLSKRFTRDNSLMHELEERVKSGKYPPDEDLERLAFGIFDDKDYNAAYMAQQVVDQLIRDYTKTPEALSLSWWIALDMFNIDADTEKEKQSRYRLVDPECLNAF